MEEGHWELTSEHLAIKLFAYEFTIIAILSAFPQAWPLLRFVDLLQTFGDNGV